MIKVRRGFSLVEMLIAISALAIVLGLCVSLIQSLRRLERGSRSNLTESARMGMLARQVRQDARSARQGKPADDEGGHDARLELTLPAGRVIEYRARAGAILRTEREGSKVRSRDTFQLPHLASASFQVRDDQGHTWLTVILRRKPAATSHGPARDARIEAALGKDIRLAGLKDKDQ